MLDPHPRVILRQSNGRESGVRGGIPPSDYPAAFLAPPSVEHNLD